jgi:hypothetical protein
MIEAIYILTYGRQGRQITFDNLPKKWQEKTFLITHPKEHHEGYPEIKCPIQGKSISKVRKWISKLGEGKRYAVFDDDITFVYTRRENETGAGNTPLKGKKFDVMMNTMDKWMDEGYIHTACDVCFNPPTRNVDFRVNSRITNNVFYDGTKLPIKKLDWGLDFCEDYYINLQLLSMGHQNKVSLMFRVNSSETQSKGGCELNRTLEKHNSAMRELNKKYPDFVKLREKITKGGLWKGKTKLAATISWKKCFQSSLKTKPDISGFFR